MGRRRRSSLQLAADAKKPSSLPKNWPNSTPEDIAAKPVRIINIGEEQDFQFKENIVKTSKYEIWSFLPLFLLEEFNPKTKMANVFFLGIACLQCVPMISNTFGYPTVMIPLSFIVFISGILQVIEDLARHKADRLANSTKVARFRVYDDEASVEEETEIIPWSRLRVGDFILLKSRESVPADLLIVSVSCEEGENSINRSHNRGICYVETKSLDGETNLKLRNALGYTTTMINNLSTVNSIKGRLEMEHPNKLIDSFTGVVEFAKDGVVTKIPIQPSNVLLRGCVLRNTDWIIGLVLNTGHDTKIMCGITKTIGKSSYLELETTYYIKKIIFLLFILCASGATAQTVWNHYIDVTSIWYLHWTNLEPGGYWFVKFFYYFLLHSQFVPVSLYVSMYLIRVFQTYFMNNDLDMYYEETDTPASVRTMTLNEELGQVSHLFSDKTGTITRNSMSFRKFSVRGNSYGAGITEIGKASWKLQGKKIPKETLEAEEKALKLAVPHVTFWCPKYEADIASNGTKKENIREFFRVLAICHDVIPEHIGNKVILSASNPDDQAIVTAADYFGYKFCDRKGDIISIEIKETKIIENIEILETIEFSSKRKRMSVIIKDKDKTGKPVIRMFTKGAESIIYERLASEQENVLKETDIQVCAYAFEGLRCLVVAYADIDQNTYNDWSKRYKKAKTDLIEIDKKKRGDSNAIELLEEEIEKNLLLLGATAVEDRLQDGVPECIEQLTAGNIKIWMLTGDKEETAINIAVACKLLKPVEYMDHIIINKQTCPTREEIKNIMVTPNTSKLAKALIVDGPSLLTITGDKELSDLLPDFTLQQCQAVVACRVSPDQKRQLVSLVKIRNPLIRTLAVGDGANDVAMIQEAHIGVGIKGEEGVQAVNSSDYAIAQFRYLEPLLLKHGHYNYVRICNLVCFVFYKNIFESTSQYWFNFANTFSGQKYFTEGAIQFFNLIFTSVPIIVYGCYDKHVKQETLKNYPQIYKLSQGSKFFTSIRFWSWILLAIEESVLVSVLPLYFLSNARYGGGLTFWDAGATCYTMVVIIVNMKMFVFQTEWLWFHFVIIFLSILSWWGIAYVINKSIFIDFDWHGIWFHLMKSGTFWLCMLNIITMVFIQDLFINGYIRAFRPNAVNILQELEKTEAQKRIKVTTDEIEMVGRFVGV